MTDRSKYSPEWICKQQEVLRGERKTVEAVWRLIRTYFIPQYGQFDYQYMNENQVDWRRRERWDDTAVRSAGLLAASLHGSLTSSVTHWFEYTFKSQPELAHQKGVREWLESTRNTIFSSLQDSNFNLEITQGYNEMVTFGTTVIMEEPMIKNGVERGIDFKCVPLEEVDFEENFEDQIHTFFRKNMYTPVQMVDKFGKDGVPEEVLERVNDGVTLKEDVVFCAYHRDGWETKDRFAKNVNPKDRAVGYKYVHLKTKEMLGEEGGYYEMPAFVGRWTRMVGSKWGYSPANSCLDTVLTTNALVKLIMTALEKVVDPTLLAKERSVINTIDLSPATINIVRDIEGVVPLESGTNFDPGELRLMRMQDSIERSFYVDQLQLKDSPAMTATEVQVRYELMQRLLGPTVSRIQKDLLNPMLERAFGILFRQGLIEPPPTTKSKTLDINYIGTLARVQRLDEVNAIERFLSHVGSIMEMGFPQAQDVPDISAILRETASVLGVPARLLHDEEKSKKMARSREESQEQMQNMAMAEQEAKINAETSR